MTMTEVDMLRHGHCKGGEIYRGLSDVELTLSGWREMLDAVELMPPWQRILCSPLNRCAAFATHLAAKLGVPVCVVEDFREIDFGAWEGQPVAQVWRDDPTTAAQFMRDPSSVTPPAGESISAARERVARGWETHCDKLSGQRVLLVVHGGTIRLLLSLWLDLPLSSLGRWAVPYASITRIQLHDHADQCHPLLISHATNTARE